MKSRLLLDWTENIYTIIGVEVGINELILWCWELVQLSTIRDDDENDDDDDDDNDHIGQTWERDRERDRERERERERQRQRETESKHTENCNLFLKITYAIS